MNWSRLFSPEVIWVLIPITGIVVWGITEILQQIHRHQERQAMIEQGMHPDLARPADVKRSVEPAATTLGNPKLRT
jgi:hypothetical protein